MLPREWLPRARAPKGKILVKRDEMASQKHGLYIPPSTLNHTRRAFGFVVDIHPSCRELWYDVGDFALLSSSGGHQIIFGLMPTEETELWVYSPDAVKMVFDEAGIDIEDRGESPIRNRRLVQQQTGTVDEKWTEGEPEGFR